MYDNTNIEEIMAIHRRVGEIQFRMAVQHLVEKGMGNFTSENVAEAKETIRKETPRNAIMQPDFLCTLVDCAYELSQFPTWDLLLYVKLYIRIQDDDLVDLEEAEQALRSWNSLMAPKAWKAAVADPELRKEILRKMIEGRDVEYSADDITAAISSVVDENQEG